MTDKKHMKDAIDFKLFMEVLESMSEDEFEDYICELEDLFYSVHSDSVHSELERGNEYD